MATITLGPIVGEVTDTSARILVETDKDAEVSCTAIERFNRTRPKCLVYSHKDL